MPIDTESEENDHKLRKAYAVIIGGTYSGKLMVSCKCNLNTFRLFHIQLVYCKLQFVSF